MSNASWDAYRRAVVEIDLPTGRERIEPRRLGTVGNFPFGDKVVYIITAFRGSERTARNLERHASLIRDLHAADLVFYNALGGDPLGDHTEVGIAALDLSDSAAIALAVRYEQDSIFRWSSLRLGLVACSDGTVEQRGWTRTAPAFG